MQTEGDVYCAVFERVLFKKYDIIVQNKWVEIQAGKKLNVFGQTIVINDTGSIVVPNNENKVATWLRETKEWIEAQDFNDLLLFIKD